MATQRKYLERSSPTFENELNRELAELNERGIDTDGCFINMGITKSVWVPASGVKAPGTKPATWIEWGISGVYQFADNDDDTIVANIKFPADMDKTIAPVLSIGWSATTTGNANWKIEYLYTQLGEDTTASAQTTAYIVSTESYKDGLVLAQLTLDVPHADDVCVSCSFSP